MLIPLMHRDERVPTASPHQLFLGNIPAYHLFGFPPPPKNFPLSFQLRTRSWLPSGCFNSASSRIPQPRCSIATRGSCHEWVISPQLAAGSGQDECGGAELVALKCPRGT